MDMCDDLCVGAVVQRLAVDLQDLVGHLEVRLVCRGPVQLDPLVVGLHEDDDIPPQVHHPGSSHALVSGSNDGGKVAYLQTFTVNQLEKLECAKAA